RAGRSTTSGNAWSRKALRCRRPRMVRGGNRSGDDARIASSVNTDSDLQSLRPTYFDPRGNKHMKKNICVAVAAIAVAVGGSTVAAQSSSSSSSRDQRDKSPVTVTGCVQSADGG